MKLQNKIFISIGLVWLVFLTTIYAGTRLLAAPQTLPVIDSSTKNHESDLNTKQIPYFLAVVVLFSILFTSVTVWLLRTLILRRLERLDHEINGIKSKQTLNKHVSIHGNDELTSVASEINALLDTIQASQENLEDRIVLRTRELLETNNLLQQEIADRKAVEQELMLHKEHLMQLAHYDNLTSLPNRVFFNEIFNKSLNHAKRLMKTLAVLFVDLDRFKNINDAFGHSVGDLVLKEIANRFSSALRAGDILARLGGDEFIILLNDISQAKFASPVADKLLKACTKPIKINQYEFFVTASIGICIFPNDGITLEDLQRNADMAMYKAKKTGGNVFQYFTRELNIEAHKHVELEAALRKAIEQNELKLLFQPKYNLLDGYIHGVEALIRWESPELGVIDPIRFIPLAEETGLIHPIGEWVLREACKTNKNWQNQGLKPISISVNLSTKQLLHQDVVQHLAAILTETGMEGRFLELEITETAMMDNTDTFLYKLNELKKLGIEITIDDFGTGYSSINYLKRFPINTIKIDQNFIKGIPQDQNDVAITNAMIAMAHNLGIKVVAEGVETAEQIQFLVDHNCDMAQGYFLSRPLPEKKIVLLLSELVGIF